MTRVTVSEAQQRLPDLLAAAETGEVIEIRGQTGRAFRLTPARPRPPVTGVPRAGSCQGLIEMTEKFDEPLEDLAEYTE
jgi:antitoxin (DNA-binding transcriptional repressor) of toxin-antitoxin stability system